MPTIHARGTCRNPAPAHPHYLRQWRVALSVFYVSFPLHPGGGGKSVVFEKMCSVNCLEDIVLALCPEILMKCDW
jgi:hypothetical protein